ncbi:Uncharacterized conserved protein [Pustulibacterium marinum]|uniref:Uncharacterized conserved protein n=1 Tax=Pustulibacterium marinum TaxID=1224947 RepID=A0A1I7IES0_9FLAO|nr:App1 family protein [Pustulibacterium marinum]SFU71356.1 Uncharacterized conserved protein [Pustulibacterium marinum]
MKLDLKIYRSYANERKIVVCGHVFRRRAQDTFNLNQKWYRHAKTVLKMFRIQTVKNAKVIFQFNDLTVKTSTLNDGYFLMTIPYEKSIDSGWHTFSITAESNNESVQKEGEFVKPFPGEYGVISDIDDTFLISHSGNVFKKLYVMLTKNIEKRHVFDGVVEHYRLLNRLGRKDNDTNNAFFYVSSSEWNLYDFIVQFTELHKFPKAVLQLKQIKNGVSDFLLTGGGSHDHKYHKINHLVEFYPELRFVLLGDDSQKDAFIYRDLSKIFPNNISTVYLRQTGKHQNKEVLKALQEIEKLGVRVCYFKNSEEAINHTKEHLG